MPIRNAAATLPETLGSITAQTFDRWELVAIDDDSMDESGEIVQTLAASDDRMRLLQPGRIGIAEALNLGIAVSAAPLLARMDADDIMMPSRLATQHAWMTSHPDDALVGSRVELFPESAITDGMREYIRWQNGCLSTDEIAANIYVESPFAHPSVMFRRGVVLEAGGYRSGDFPEDYELWLRMNAAGMRMSKAADVLLRWRERSDRASRVDPRYSRDAFDAVRSEYLARDRRLHGSREIVFWGAGRRTRSRVRRLRERGIRGAAWIDIDPRKIGRTVEGLPVVAPEWLERSERPFVLVYVTNHGARELIGDLLARMGYRSGEDWLAVG